MPHSSQFIRPGAPVLGLLIVIILFQSLASAQYSSVRGLSFRSPYQANMDTILTHMIQRKTLENALKRRAGANAGEAGAAQAVPQAAVARPVRLEDFQFRYSGMPLMPGYIADALGRNPAEKKQFTTAFHGILNAVMPEFRKNGNPYDLSLAWSFYVLSMYSVLHPEQEIDEPTTDRVIAQARTQLLDGAAVRDADAATKQALWESLVILAGFTGGGYQKSVQENDADTAKAMQNVAAEGLRAWFKLDPSLIRVDPSAAQPLGMGTEAEAEVSMPALGGMEHVDWMSFPLPPGWTAERTPPAVTLAPPGGEKLRVLVAPLPGVRWETAETAAWQNLAGPQSIGQAMKFQDAVQTGVLTNGWGYRTQIAHMQNGGRACVLLLRRGPETGAVMIMTIADGTGTMNRHLQTVFNHFTQQAR